MRDFAPASPTPNQDAIRMPVRRDASSPVPSAKESGTLPAVVGIGASAGGLGALRTLFSHVPRETGVAWVVVVHLSPEHTSHLDDLLQPHVRMPVRQVTETVVLEPDHVYVIPPGAHLNAVDTHLRLSRLDAEGGRHAPIDHFLRTLAATHDGRSVGVILTGTGVDGSLGIRSIKERNGFTVVQDPGEAEHDGMPQSALSTGVVDRVLRLEEIPDAVLGFAATRPDVRVPEEGEEAGAEQFHLMGMVLGQISARTGRDFSRYEHSVVLRRIRRRMRIRRVERLDAYVDMLRSDPAEVRDLEDDLLTTVTSFFADPEIWRELESRVVPRLFERVGPGEGIRAWSVGCATGEEAYSLAMVLLAEAARHPDPPPIQVFASDLHERSLERARDGFFPGEIGPDVGRERLSRFFHRENGGYRVRKEVRDRVVFAPHDLLGDPPFSRVDLISCRNPMHHLQRDALRQVLEAFHYALRPDGYLVLGSAKPVEGQEFFRTESDEHRLFRRRALPGREGRSPPFAHGRTDTARRGWRTATAGERIPGGVLHLKLLEEYAPPGILVGPDDRVVHLSEHAGRYLLHASGEATLNVFRLVREALRAELRAALHTVRETAVRVRSRPIPLRVDGKSVAVVLDVRPVRGPEHAGYALVVFDDRAAPAPVPQPSGTGEPGDHDARARTREADPGHAEQHLQAIVDKYESSQEELRASNEELQSANEELRSTMEELETSREELQSMNEELQTVSQENRHRVDELSQLTSDLQNLLASTEIATLFLDREMRILRFTPRVAELFSMRPADRGRPLSDLTTRLGYAELPDDAAAVLRTLERVEREVEEEAGRWYLTRVLPYRGGESRIDGVAITFVDITERKRAEEALRESEERHRLIVESALDYAIFMMDPEGIIESWSPGAQAVFGWPAEEIIGRSVDITFTPEDRAEDEPAKERRTARAEGSAPNVRWHVRRDGSPVFIEGVARLLRSEDGEVRGFLKVGQDMTERRRMEDTMRELNQTLELRVAERTAALEREVAARREVLRRLVEAEENERRRISRELHDQMGQHLTGLLLGLRAIQSEAWAPELVERLRSLEVLAGATARDMQSMAVELRPPALDTLGLVAAVQSHMEEWSTRHGIESDFHARGLDGVRLSPEVETTLYRVVQEALTNVLKHAGAERVGLLLEWRDGLARVILEDDGAGFDVDAVLASPDKARRLGVRGMRERVALLGGELEIESAPGDGTTLYVRVPAPEEETDA
jgi:two-component system, chemotaxis family, CheB/CheR fusion protein